MQYLPGESPLYTRLYGFTITNQRVIFEASGIVQMAEVDQVDYCEFRKFHRPWILVVGVLALVIAFYLGSQQTAPSGSPVIAGIVGLGMIVYYVGTRRSELHVHAGAGIITVTVAGLKTNIVEEAMNAVHGARMVMTGRLPGQMN